VHIIESEEFFAGPAGRYRELIAFLGLRPFTPASFDTYNARPGAAMDPGIRRMLSEYYRPHDERLAVLLGREPGWLLHAR
jgi:hypothetical protein